MFEGDESIREQLATVAENLLLLRMDPSDIKATGAARNSSDTVPHLHMTYMATAYKLMTQPRSHDKTGVTEMSYSGNLPLSRIAKRTAKCIITSSLEAINDYIGMYGGWNNCFERLTRKFTALQRESSIFYLLSCYCNTFVTY